MLVRISSDGMGDEISSNDACPATIATRSQSLQRASELSVFPSITPAAAAQVMGCLALLLVPETI